MFSVITNIYNKKTERPSLLELFTATGKLKNFFLTTRDFLCVHHGWHDTHRYDIQVLATQVSTCWNMCGKNLNIVLMCVVSHVDVCVARTWISYRCALCHPWCTHRKSLVVKKNFFSFPVSVNNSIKVGPLVFFLQMFVITENIMKSPVKRYFTMTEST